MKRYEPVIKDTGLHTSGVQSIYRFPNGYGASVVRFMIVIPNVPDRYGSYTDDETEVELAVIKFDGEGNGEFGISYDTPITDDVIGHLKDDGLQQALSFIEGLNKSGNYRGKGYPDGFVKQ